MIVDRVRVSQVNALKAEPVARLGIVSSRWLQLRTSRSAGHARRFLGDYRGALMVDGYGDCKAGFAAGITEIGGWAHARRKFFYQHKASGSPISPGAHRAHRGAVPHRGRSEGHDG